MHNIHRIFSSLIACWQTLYIPVISFIAISFIMGDSECYAHEYFWCLKLIDNILMFAQLANRTSVIKLPNNT